MWEPFVLLGNLLVLVMASLDQADDAVTARPVPEFDLFRVTALHDQIDVNPLNAAGVEIVEDRKVLAILQRTVDDRHVADLVAVLLFPGQKIFRNHAAA